MDTWNSIVIIAGILSLIFHLSGKGSSFRQFSLPLTTGLVGFTLGRYNGAVTAVSDTLLQDPHLIFLLIILIAFFALAMYIVESTKSEAKISFILLAFLATVVVPQLIKSYNDIAPMVATPDYLSLARIKENDGQTNEAIEYLQIYAKRIDRTELRQQINARIAELRKHQINKELSSQTRP